MSRIENVARTDKRLIEKLEEVCGLNEMLTSRHDCRGYSKLLLYVTPAYYYTIYTRRVRSGEHDIMCHDELVQLVTPLFPALPVYSISWGLKPERGLLPTGIIQFEVKDERSLLISCKPSLRLLTPPGAPLQQIASLSKTIEETITWLTLFAMGPAECMEVETRAAAIVHTGYESVGLATLTPFIMQVDKHPAVYAIDPWKLNLIELDDVRIEGKISEENVVIERIAIGSWVIGIAWIIFNPHVARGENRYVIRPVVFAEYKDKRSLTAPLVMLVFAARARRESLRTLFEYAKRECSNCETNTSMLLREFAKSVVSVAQLAANKSKTNDSSSIIELLLKISSKELGVTVFLDSIFEDARRILHKLDVSYEVRPDDTMIRIALRDASEILMCREQSVSAKYNCSNTYFAPLRALRNATRTIPPHKFVQLFENSTRLAIQLYGDIFANIVHKWSS